ncbi:MAG TPA: DUF2092 domain-containing protein [Caulobacteraceae bacterium]|jgi:hypothetical protein
MPALGVVKAVCLGASLIALTAAAPLAAWSQATPAPASASAKAAPAKKKPAAAATAPKGVVEPASVAALGKMSAYLRTLPAFEIKMATQRDEVDVYGQLVTLNGESTYKVKKPDAFHIAVAEDAGARQFNYDGKSVTVYDPKTGYYARFDAPPTIRQTLDAAKAKYGVAVPLDDLFHWDQGDAQSSKLTSGHFVGATKVDGQDADQYAFRQPGVDWQIWIAKGDKPVPLRVVLVGSDDPARPQFEANLSWDTAPQFAADTFAFTPPAGAKAIQIRTLSP